MYHPAREKKGSASSSFAAQAKSRSAREIATAPAPRAVREANAGGDEPDQQRGSGEGRVIAQQVRTVFPGGGGTPVTTVSSGGSAAPTGPNTLTARQAVGPTGAPTTGTAGNNCTPGVETLTWNVVDAGTNWRANVQSLNVGGTLNVRAWPSNPSSTATPNTPNPVDGGNITQANAQSCIDDMADYDTAGTGGAGADWHATAASRAHEWAHWNDDYIADVIPNSGWGATNTAIDAMTVPKAGNADAAAARTALQPRVTTRFNAFVSAATARWNNSIIAVDRPGLGGRGYAAGMGVLNGLIAQVRTYKNSKGW